MLEQTSPQAMLFFTLYGGAATMALLLCLYLLLSKVNVIAPGITPPATLRRWAAAFLGVAAAGHCYWLLAYTIGFEKHTPLHALLGMLDGIGLLVTLFGTMLSMLQDRRRPLKPFLAAIVPIVVLEVLQIVRPDIDFVPPMIVYVLSLYTVFTIYMAIAVRQYQRWLRDNYADLEHKEVWASYTLLIVVLLLIVNYGVADDSPSLLFIRLTNFVLFALLLWRVETLQDLSISRPTTESLASLTKESLPMREGSDYLQGENPTAELSTPLPQREEQEGGSLATAELSTPHPHRENQGSGSAGSSVIASLLEEKCEKTGLYLQNDLSIVQLSVAIGINRSYLSQYFSSQGINYNSYINGLRIDHFICRYHEFMAHKEPFTAQELAQECGYRSYSTFSLAFKQRMGRSVSAWMHDTAQDETG